MDYTFKILSTEISLNREKNKLTHFLSDIVKNSYKILFMYPPSPNYSEASVK